MMERLALGLGSSVLSTLVFIGAMHIHFPSDALVERARWAVQTSSKGDYALEASSAGWWMPGGITLSDAALLKVDKSRRSRSDEDAGQSGSPMVRADSASV